MPLALSLKTADAKPQRLFRMNAEKRNIPRVTISIGGRFMRENRTEHGCAAIEASVQSMRIETDVVCEVGEKIIGYFYTIGRIEGKIAQLTENGFILEIATTVPKRDKLASQFTWLANRSILNLPEDRRHDRIVPRNPGVTVRNLSSPHAIILHGHLIDVSRSGAGVSVQGEFKKGDELMLGSTPAKVVRAFDGGIAVEFYSSVPDGMFDESIRL
ncbi:MAG: pilus assembly protein PilZ [Rhizobiales bacterium PAR1]|nr:MAG: pilus assembly protein PilZ [Rhizobiales bacterium PAR1]